MSDDPAPTLRPPRHRRHVPARSLRASDHDPRPLRLLRGGAVARDDAYARAARCQHVALLAAAPGAMWVYGVTRGLRITMRRRRIASATSMPRRGCNRPGPDTGG
jgi:hypothetical protein